MLKAVLNEAWKLAPFRVAVVHFFPSIEGGKFIREDDKIIFPLSITSHHATTDGYHVAEFYREFQEMADDFSLFLS